ncbi:hypothetical protein PMAYCL1PPCAC_17866, partial [Pristionchus mayeri]
KKKRSNAEEDDQFSSRESPLKEQKVRTMKRPSILTQATIDDSWDSDSSQSEKIEEGRSSPRPPSRKIFSSSYAVIRNRKAHSILPSEVFYSSVRFDPIQDVVDFDGAGKQSTHDPPKEKGTNPYRR